MVLMLEEKTYKPSLKRLRGNLIVFTGPSGVGKGTVVSEVIKDLPDLEFSISATTRSIREGEKDGVNYFYKSKEDFQDLIDRNQLLEWAEFVGNYYGTPRDFVEDELKSGKDVLLEIEVQGALQVKEKFPEAIMIFLLPPSLEELENRLRKRSTEDDAAIKKRLEKARLEMTTVDSFQYFIVNDEIKPATEKLKSIIISERSKIS